MNLQDRMKKLVQEKKIENNNQNKEQTSLNKEIALQEYNFSIFQDIGVELLTYLEDQSLKIKETTVKAHTELGKIFSETQEKLSNNKIGCFEEWYTLLGFKKQSVYNYINRFNFIQENLNKKELIESLPLKLVYTISNPNCHREIIDLVLAEEIKTYQELIAISQPNIDKRKKEEIEILDTVEADEFYNLQKKIGQIDFTALENSKKKKLYNLYRQIEELLN